MAPGRTRPQWSDVRDLLHLRLNDVAALLNTTTIYLKQLCAQNGFPHWPGKKIRYLKATGKKFTLEEMSSEVKKMTDDEMIRIHAPVSNHTPGELTTLNLIDKVGLQSTPAAL